MMIALPLYQPSYLLNPIHASSILGIKKTYSQLSFDDEKFAY